MAKIQITRPCFQKKEKKLGLISPTGSKGGGRNLNLRGPSIWNII